MILAGPGGGSAVSVARQGGWRVCTYSVLGRTFSLCFGGLCVLSSAVMVGELIKFVRGSGEGSTKGKIKRPFDRGK